MHYKIERAIKKNRKFFIVFFILWFILVITFVTPLSYSIVEAEANGGNLNLENLLEYTGQAFQHFIGTFGKMFLLKYMGTFINTLLKFSFCYLIVLIIGIWRSAPKHEYGDIEHGSSDWCEFGEQYSVLNSKKGILLAEKNYLPVDKRGNTNVLVVGRIRFW